MHLSWIRLIKLTSHIFLQICVTSPLLVGWLWPGLAPYLMHVPPAARCSGWSPRRLAPRNRCEEPRCRQGLCVSRAPWRRGLTQNEGRTGPAVSTRCQTPRTRHVPASHQRTGYWWKLFCRVLTSVSDPRSAIWAHDSVLKALRLKQVMSGDWHQAHLCKTPYVIMKLRNCFSVESWPTWAVLDLCLETWQRAVLTLAEVHDAQWLTSGVYKVAYLIPRLRLQTSRDITPVYTFLSQLHRERHVLSCVWALRVGYDNIHVIFALVVI